MSYSVSSCRLALFAGALLFPALAHAQDPEAVALFTAAKDLAAKGQWADACPKFEAAQRKEPALGRLLNVADCHEHIQLLFRAWGEWKVAYEQAKKANDDARADLAHKHVEALEPRLPYLKVNVTGQQADLSVWRDDKQLDAAEYNTDLPINPGSRTIAVRRGAATLSTKSVEMSEKEHQVVTFDLDAIAKAHPAPVEPPPGKTTDGGKVVQTNTVVVEAKVGEQKSTPAGKVVANIFLGVGLTAAVFGEWLIGVAALLGQKGNDCFETSATLDQWQCSSSRVTNIDTAKTSPTWASASRSAVARSR